MWNVPSQFSLAPQRVSDERPWSTRCLQDLHALYDDAWGVLDRAMPCRFFAANNFLQDVDGADLQFPGHSGAPAPRSEGDR